MLEVMNLRGLPRYGLSCWRPLVCLFALAIDASDFVFLFYIFMLKILLYIMRAVCDSFLLFCLA